MTVAGSTGRPDEGQRPEEAKPQTEVIDFQAR
jgi:hypothetical protein